MKKNWKNLKTFLALIHPDDIESTQKAIKEKLLVGDQIINLENRCRCKNGRYKWFCWVAHPNLKQGKSFAVGREITGHKRIEISLKETEKIANVGGWKWDIQRDEFTMSEQWRQIHGIQKTKLTMVELMTLAHPDDATLIEKSFKNAIAGIKPYDLIHRVIRRDDKEVRSLHAKAIVTFDNEGKPLVIHGSSQDITTQRELALGDVDAKTDIADDLHEIYAAGVRAKDLVGQILTFARQSDESLKPIQVGEIVKEVLKFIRSTIPTTIQIKQTVMSDSFIMASPTQVHQIVMNLCTNAAHAMEGDGGTLEVTVKDILINKLTNREGLKLKSGNYVEIKVLDTGCGMEPHIAKTIFEPYFTTKQPGEGTGMGLALVHGIIETYCGEIFVESSPGVGTVFKVYIPMTKRKNLPMYDEVTELPMGQERILFVDDEAPILKMASRTLSMLGYSVTTCISSSEALELFQSKPDSFDLIISDMTMPNMTGQRIRAYTIWNLQLKARGSYVSCRTILSAPCKSERA